MEPKEIQAHWRQLLADKKDQQKAGEMPSLETDTSVSGGKIRLAISDNDFCALLLPIALDVSVEPDQISQLIAVRPVKLGVRRKVVRFLEVRCEDERLNEVFARVVSDILRRIEAGTSPLKAVDEALLEFRKLLHKKKVSSQDERTIVGLVGELLTLIRVLEVDPRGVSAWHGPDSDRHDFRAGAVTIEVKTSLGADGNRIHVNGMRQLESPGSGCLLIRHIRIEPDPNGELSVPDLVAQAGTCLKDQSDFEAKLENLGYSDDAAESWGAKRYRRVGAVAYEVADGFPRLIPDLLDADWPLAGVSGVSYEVDLGAASDFQVDEDAWDNRLKEFCECL